MFVCLLLFLVVGCLGRYAYTQNFPVYALASITQVRSMQRLDAVFTGVWMMGLVVKLAFDMYCCRLCAAALQKEPGEAKSGAWLSAALMLGLALWAAMSPLAQRFLLDTRILFLCTAAAGFAIPLLVLAADLLSRRGEKQTKKAP